MYRRKLIVYAPRTEETRRFLNRTIKYFRVTYIPSNTVKVYLETTHGNRILVVSGTLTRFWENWRLIRRERL